MAAITKTEPAKVRRKGPGVGCDGSRSVDASICQRQPTIWTGVVAYVPTVPAPTERQTDQPSVKHQVVEKDRGTVWVKPPAEVTTYNPTLMKGQNPNSEWLSPTPVLDLLIDIDSPNRFAPWDRRVSGSVKWYLQREDAIMRYVTTLTLASISGWRVPAASGV